MKNKTCIICKQSIYLFLFAFFISLYVLPDILTNAGTLKIEKVSFNNYEENYITIASKLDAAKNRILAVNYAGPDRVLGCECKNNLMIKVYKTFDKSGKKTTELFYSCDWFDWKESKLFYIYLPLIEEWNSYYTVELLREPDIEHNKGRFDINYAYDPTGTHQDKLHIYAETYLIDSIGLKETEFNVGEVKKAEFKSDDYVGLIKWSSSNSFIVSADDDGTITAQSSGNATISLSINEETVFQQKIIVNPAPAIKDISLLENEVREISLEGIKGNIEWSSNDESVAIVSDGVVIGKKAGIATISGKINNLTMKFNVKVLGPELSNTKVNLFTGETFLLNVDNLNSIIKWNSENPNIATIENGLIKAISPGTTVVSAIVGKNILKCSVIVKNNKLNYTEIDIESGEEIQLSHISGVKGKWYSVNTDIVEIVDEYDDHSINVVGKNFGTTTVKLQIESEILECKINVKSKKPPTGIDYEKSSKEIRLYWNMCDYADYYNIYIYNDKTNKYQVIESTLDEFCVITELKPDTSYKFKISAAIWIYNDIIDQELSETINIKTDKKDKEGLINENGVLYFYEEGFCVTDEEKVVYGGETYFLDINRDGIVLQDTFVEFDNSIYKTDKNGKMIHSTEIEDEAGNKYYVADDGKVYLKLVLETKLFSGMEVDLSDVTIFDFDDFTKLKSKGEKIAKIDKYGNLHAIQPGQGTILGILNNFDYFFGSLYVKYIPIELSYRIEKREAPSSFDYEKSSGIIKLNWKKCKYNVYSYSIYKYNKDRKKYELIGSTFEPQYIIKNLSPNTAYSFKIAANMKYEGIISEQLLSEKISIKTDKKDKSGIIKENGRAYYYEDGFLVRNKKIVVDGNIYFTKKDGSVRTDSFIEYDDLLYKTDKNGKAICDSEVIDKSNGFTYIASSDGILYLKTTLDFKIYSGMKYNLKIKNKEYLSDFKYDKNKSNNKKIAYVEDGYLYVNKPGSLIVFGYIDNDNSIKLKNEKGTFSTNYKKIAIEINILESHLQKDEIVINLGEPINIVVKGSKADPEFESSNKKVVSIINGLPVSVGIGKAKVKVKIKDEILKCKITVNKLPAPQNIRYETDVKTIRLEWDDYDAAYNYSIYSYDSIAKKYILIGQTKKAYFKVKNLEPDTLYNFKISANIKIYGVVSEQKISEKVECRTIKDINGWITENGKKYYYKNGHPIGEGLLKIKGKYYIFDENHALLVKCFTSINQKKYYSDSEGIVICNKEVTDNTTGIVYVADKYGVLSVKPYVPYLKDTSDYKVINSYTYKTSGGKYQYLVYVVEAKRTAEVRLELIIKNKNGDVCDTCNDQISLTKGKKNVFILQTYNGYIDYSFRYSFSTQTSTTFWSGDTDAVKVEKYNCNNNYMYITVKQTKSNLGIFAQLKILFFNNGKLVKADDLHYNVYANGLNKKGDEDVISYYLYGTYFDKVVFYYEDR